MKLPDWTREPLVHFLLGGAVLFGWFSWQGTPVDPASRAIDIDQEVLAAIAQGYEQQMGRAPTDSELDNLVERYVREEVLYREALRLGLDQDDAVVRRRLAQKMDLIAAAQVEAATPDDAVLQAWLESHPQRFASDAQYSFDQIWFVDQDAAETALALLANGSDWREIGSMIELPASVDEMDRSEILDRFGQQFTQEIDALEPSGNWQGPLPSGLGWHVVRLRNVSASTTPPLSEVRARVETDWRSATAADRRSRAYNILREAYTVEIDR